MSRCDCWSDSGLKPCPFCDGRPAGEPDSAAEATRRQRLVEITHWKPDSDGVNQLMEFVAAEVTAALNAVADEMELDTAEIEGEFNDRAQGWLDGAGFVRIRATAGADPADVPVSATCNRCGTTETTDYMLRNDRRWDFMPVDGGAGPWCCPDCRRRLKEKPGGLR